MGVGGPKKRGSIVGSIRGTIGEWVPPAALRLLRKPRTDTRVFNSYADALEVCGDGYEADIIAEVVVAKTEAIRGEIEQGHFDLDLGALRTLIALGFAERKQALKVVDFGGAAGFHYFIARSMSEPDRTLEWRVVETVSMSRAASRLANSELSFFSSIAAVKDSMHSPPDLVFASGVLMCVPDPIGVLRDLLSLRAARVFVTRTGLSLDKTTRVIAQKFTLAENGPGPLPAGVVDQVVSCPDTFVPMEEFEGAIVSAGYRIVARINEDTDVWIAGDTPIHQYGYLCELSENTSQYRTT